MSIRILSNGVLDTLQDQGRWGYGYLGINPGGAMDRVAMQVANLLAGNDPAEAVLEMHIPAAAMEFEEPMLIALAGADLSASINGEAVPVLHPLLVQKGSILRFGKRTAGARVYLSVKGGFAVDIWLGSASTNTKASAGGFKGRPLQKNDRLPCKEKQAYGFAAEQPVTILPWFANISGLYSKGEIRFIPGNEYGLLDETSRQKLEKGPCLITRESDRMGFRLQTGTLRLVQHKELVSTAVTRGTIQLLPDGQMIILMADHPTTGGYPVIGYVTSSSLPSLAQMQPGESFLLQQTTLAFAETSVCRQQMIIQQLQYACDSRLETYFNQRRGTDLNNLLLCG